jgi:hypothetical protein
LFQLRRNWAFSKGIKAQIKAQWLAKFVGTNDIQRKIVLSGSLGKPPQSQELSVAGKNVVEWAMQRKIAI